MAKKRTYDVTVTPIDGAGAPITFVGEQAQAFYTQYKQWLSGVGEARGFAYPTASGTEKTLLYKNIKETERSVITESDTTDFAKKDLTICA